MTGLAIVVAVLLIAADAFFVSVEFALLGSRRAVLEPLAADGNRRALRALDAISDLNRQLSGAQLGITMTAIALGFVAEPAVAHLLESGLDAVADLPHRARDTIGFVVALTIVAFFHMVLGEVVPKNLALAGPERTAMRLAPVHRMFVAALSPLISLLAWLAGALSRAVGIEPKDELSSAHTPEELATMLDASHGEGLIGEFEHSLLSSALGFGERTLDTVLVPRNEVVTVSADAPVSEVERVVVESGHSRLPVVGEDLDDLYGFVHAKDLLTPGGGSLPVSSRRIHRMLVLRVDRNLEDALLAMRRSRVHLAAVRDESGAVVGIVTLEDLVEELVGEIRDETDVERLESSPG